MDNLFLPLPEYSHHPVKFSALKSGERKARSILLNANRCVEFTATGCCWYFTELRLLPSDPTFAALLERLYSHSSPHPFGLTQQGSSDWGVELKWDMFVADISASAQLCKVQQLLHVCLWIPLPGRAACETVSFLHITWILAGHVLLQAPSTSTRMWTHAHQHTPDVCSMFCVRRTWQILWKASATVLPQLWMLFPREARVGPTASVHLYGLWVNRHLFLECCPRCCAYLFFFCPVDFILLLDLLFLLY